MKAKTNIIEVGTEDLLLVTYQNNMIPTQTGELIQQCIKAWRDGGDGKTMVNGDGWEVTVVRRAKRGWFHRIMEWLTVPRYKPSPYEPYEYRRPCGSMPVDEQRPPQPEAGAVL